MKFSIILFLVASLGSSDMLVSSQDEEPSPTNEIKKKAPGQKGYVRGSHSHARRELLQWAITSPDLVDFHLGFDQSVRELRESAISINNSRKNLRVGSVPSRSPASSGLVRTASNSTRLRGDRS
jgi:hypothetical protein